MDKAEYHGDRGGYFPCQKTFWDATTCFFAKRRLKDERSSKFHLANASDCSCRVGNLLQPIRSTTQIWVATSNGWFSGSCANQFPYQSGQIFLIWTLAKVDSAGLLTLFHSLNEALRCNIVFFQLTVTKFGFIGKSLLQWRFQGIQPPSPPRLISRSKWGPKGRKKIFETGPPSLYVRVWIPPPPPLPLYRGLDPPMPVTKFLDVNERIYMILSFVPGEGLKVIESGFSGAACEQQTYFRSSLLSLPTTGNASAVRRLLVEWPFSFRTLIFTARKIGFTQIYSVQIWCKKVFSFWRTIWHETFYKYLFLL